MTENFKTDFSLEEELNNIKDYINSCVKVNTKAAMALYFTPSKYRHIGAIFNNSVQKLIDEDFLYDNLSKERIEHLLNGLGAFNENNKELRNRLISITNEKQVFDMFYILEKYTRKIYRLSELVNEELKYKTRKLIYKAIMDFHFLMTEILETYESSETTYSIMA